LLEVVCFASSYVTVLRCAHPGSSTEMSEHDNGARPRRSSPTSAWLSVLL